MSSEATVPNETPNQTDVIPDTYAIYVDNEQIHVWQYRVEVFEPNGQWYSKCGTSRQNSPN